MDRALEILGAAASEGCVVGRLIDGERLFNRR